MTSGSGARVSSSIVESSVATCSAKYLRSHGTPVNCRRCVTSCRHTHIRKSSAGTSKACCAPTMFGATSSNRPASCSLGLNGSYWPSTRELRNDSTTPACTPGRAREHAGHRARLPWHRGGRQRGKSLRRRLHPRGTVDHLTGQQRQTGAEPGELPDVHLGLRRELAESADHVVGLVLADHRTGPHQPAGGRHRQLPVHRAELCLRSAVHSADATCARPATNSHSLATQRPSRPKPAAPRSPGCAHSPT